VSVAGLLLSDSRFPAGGHAHSGGVEPAVTAGSVRDLGSLELFLRGRLRTAGLVAAAVAACACAHASETGRAGGTGAGAAAGTGDQTGQGAAAGTEAAAPVRDDFWAELDAETDARTPAPAQREASRRQGRALLRAARVTWPEAGWLTALADSARAAAGVGAGSPAGIAATTGGPAGRTARDYRGGPHHAVVLGVAAAAAGCDPAEAARIAAYQAVAGPVSAAVRLLALDPMRATGVLARLAAAIDLTAADGAGYASRPLCDLPAPSGPALDLLAEVHMKAEVRLFES
jgi:urease accessory protein